MLWSLSWDDYNCWSMVHTLWGITMLWPLSWEDDNCQSMFHTLGIKKHALTVVMRWWQLTEHRSYLMGYNCALTVVMRRWQLKKHDSYRRDILQCSDRCHETMATDEHESHLRDILPCSYRCREAMAICRACIIPQGWITILFPLSWDDDNLRSMFHAKMIYYNDLTVAMRRWQLMEHVLYLRGISP